MKKNAKIIYAQSSDIKSRTYLEYRKDMKKKAIAELEIIDWLKNKLSEEYKKNVEVKKAGGDKYIWFLRNGGVTGEADFEVLYDDKVEQFEFQYADKRELKYFDFKVSKVGKKIDGRRIPYDNKKFIYIVKPTSEYAIIEPAWIIENGKEEGVPAWGNRTAFRIPKEKLEKILKKDSSLKEVIENIDIKVNLLNFGYDFIKKEEEKLSFLLQSVVDENKILKIIPKEFESFYQVCFLMDKLNKIPTNCNLWLIYLFTFLKEKFTSYQMAQFIYCVDFLYSKIELKENEIINFVEIIDKIKKYCLENQNVDGYFSTSINISPKEELRNLVFTIHLLEDLIQDSIYNYNITRFKPIKKIFENLNNIKEIYNILDNINY